MHKKKIVLYGAGNTGEKWLQKLGKDAVYAFSDRNQKIIGKEILGKKIISLEQICKEDNILIFPSVSYEKINEVRDDIIKAGAGDKLITTPLFDFGKVLPGAYCGTEVKYEGQHYLGNNSYIENSSLGYASYISYNTVINNADIGKYVSIGPNVEIILGQHPTSKFVSTHPAFYSPNHSIGFSYTEKQLFDEYRYVENGKSISIGNDVWIGNGVKLMEGISIADGTIIAAGSMVVKNTEPYSVIGGNPAKLIKYRFTPRDIEFLLNLRWWNKDKTWIKKYCNYFDNIEHLKEKVQEEGCL